jgi:hypothetical protein
MRRRLVWVLLLVATGAFAQTVTVNSSTVPPVSTTGSIATSGTVSVNGSGLTTYTAGTSITLNPGFTANSANGGTFIASIAPTPITPSSGAGGVQTLSVTANDPTGYGNIQFIQLIYNWQPSGVDGCLLNYDVTNDALELADVTGSLSTFGSMMLSSPSGTLGDLVSSNCSVNAAGSGIVKSGNNITLNLNMTFSASFIGQQNIYMMTTSSDQQQPGSFQQIGTWTAYGASSAPPTAAPVTSFNSMDGTISLQFTDTNGFGYVPYGRPFLAPEERRQILLCSVLPTRLPSEETTRFIKGPP